MKLISLTCPNCNANLDNIDPKLKQCYCQYCGTKIMLDDGTIKHETHIYDEAKIMATKYNEMRKDRELDIQQEEKKEDRALGKKMIKYGGGIIVIAILLGLILPLYYKDSAIIIGAIGALVAFLGFTKLDDR